MPDKPSINDHISAAKTRLVHLAGLGDRTDTTERNIRDAAKARRTAVEAELAALRSRVNLDPAAAEQYESLTLERGQLDVVLATAQEALGSK